MPKTEVTNLGMVKLHKMLRGNYSARWTEDNDLACKTTLTRMIAERGEQKTQRAVLDCIKQEQFFEAANLWKYVPRDYEQAERCPRCRDSEGWLYVLVDGEKMPRAAKCGHRSMEPTMSVWVGPTGERRQVQATCCDYIDSQVGQ